MKIQSVVFLNNCKAVGTIRGGLRNEVRRFGVESLL